MSGQWISHDPQVQADSSPHACQTGPVKPTSIKRCVWSMTCASAVRYEGAAMPPLPEQSTGCSARGYLPFIAQTLLGYILVPICCAKSSVLTAGAIAISHPPADQSDGSLLLRSASMGLHAARGRPGATPGNGKPRRLTSEQRSLQKRDEPGLVTATTTLHFPSGRCHY